MTLFFLHTSKSRTLGEASPRMRDTDASGVQASSQTIGLSPSPGLPASSRMLRTTTRNVAGDQSLVPGVQSSLQKRFSLCEMPLVELAEQLTLIELAMFRYVNFAPPLFLFLQCGLVSDRY